MRCPTDVFDDLSRIFIFQLCVPFVEIPTWEFVQEDLHHNRLAIFNDDTMSLFRKHLAMILLFLTQILPCLAENLNTSRAERVNAALDRLEAAEKAAQEAREKVLNEGVG